MGMLGRSVLTVGLFAAVWTVCEQIVGLDADASLTTAAALLIIAVAGQVFWAFHRTNRMLRWDMRSQQARWNEPHLRPDDRRTGRTGQVPRSGGYQVPREEPGPPGTSPQWHPWDASAPQRAQTIESQYIQLIIDDAGFDVRKRRRTAVGGRWEEYLQMRWLEVAGMEFAADRYDSVVALYAWTVAGTRRHVADSGFLSQSEWIKLRELIAQATNGRLMLDLADRDNPRSTRPDW